MRYFLRVMLGIVSVGTLLMLIHIIRGEVRIDNHINHEQCRWAFLGIYALFSILTMALISPNRDTAPKEVKNKT